jgi:hypothetical protein
MGLSLRTSLRTAQVQLIITDAGSGAKLKFYDGSVPSGVDPIGGGNTLLATGSWVGAIGTAVAAVLEWDEEGLTQDNSLHVGGTPTFADITTSANVVIGRVTIGSGASNWHISLPIENGVDIVLTNLSFTAGNA